GRGHYRVELMEQVSRLKSQDEVVAMEKTIANKGYYPVRLDEDQLADYQEHPERVEELFTRCVLERVRQWMEWADAKLNGSGVQVYVCPGNDDVFEVDDVVRQGRVVCLAEDRVVDLDDRLCMISTGWSNRTPWKTHRELDEPDLETKIEAMASRVPDMSACIFNMHCPAYASKLDEAAELDENMRPKFAGNVLAPVGSKAVRAEIERHQPPLALFGHIHEARGIARIGKTLCINPGSSYEQGILLGARIDFDGRKIVSHTLTSG
ncbi:MAG: metallophosphoesterase, partial [Chloroflexi bacterium]|nr:metallophosphoesterase [Chloroflexota bacterium]